MHEHAGMIIGVVTAIVAVFGLSFTVFWSIIKNVENRLTEKIELFGSMMTKCQAGRAEILKNNEAVYVRKREHDLEFALLKEKLDGMKDDIKALETAIKNGNKE